MKEEFGTIAKDFLISDAWKNTVQKTWEKMRYACVTYYKQFKMPALQLFLIQMRGYHAQCVTVGRPAVYFKQFMK